VLGPRDVGNRVVVRRVVAVRDGRPMYSDVLGELVELDATGLTVSTRRGAVRVPLADVRAAKRVPPARHRPTADEIEALERVGSEVWPAAERARLGDWELRASGGWTSRANSALPLGDPGLPLADAIDAVAGWYAARGLPARINVPLPGVGVVGDALEEAGWLPAPRVLVQTAPLAALLERVPGRADLPPVRLDPTPSREWLTVVERRKRGLPPEALDVLAARTATRPVEVAFASVVEAGLLVAIARGAVVDGYLHLGLLEVAEAARRRGLATHVTGALARWASGAHTVLLQVEEINMPAVDLYTRLGLRTHHSYVSRIAPVLHQPPTRPA
jgi:ribosomal protein S18 acetylase RimI-like enzyme